MERSGTSIRDLPDEILLTILAQIEPAPEIISVENRAWLSVESFRPPPPKDEGGASVAEFRCVCRKFSQIGIHHQFKRVVTRFSPAGFRRLQQISAHPHIANVVQKFSYMVPRFYLRDRARIQALQRIADNEGRGDALGEFFIKAREQVDMMENMVDVHTLEAAIAAFKNLQHIRLLRVQDQLDVQFLSYLNGHRDIIQQYVQLEWTSELRAAGTLGRAVLSSRSPATLWPTRWSFPLIGIQSAMLLSNSPSAYLTSMAARLECLSLRFEGSADLNNNLRQLAPLFRTVFYPGSGLISVHIGFPQQAVSIPLEDVFQNVRLEKLRVFSIGGWRLDAEEIINLARRYRTSLRGLRLHGVLLKDGSVWRDVLKVLRQEMQSLQWLSLSRADYATHFDENATLMDVTEDSDIGPADDEDDSSNEGDLDDDVMDHVYGEGDASEPGDDDRSDDSSNGDDEARPDSDTDSVSDLDPAAHAFTMQVEAPDYEHVCTCSFFSHLEDVDDLGDNGIYVTPRQRKLWESWVVGCLVHRSRRPDLSNHTGSSEPGSADQAP